MAEVKKKLKGTISRIIDLFPTSKIAMCRLTKSDYDKLMSPLKERYKTLYGDSYLEEKSDG